MSQQSNYAFIVTAEHASSAIPHECGGVFNGFIETLETHQIYDVGIKPIAEAFAGFLNCPLLLGEVTRLAVDLNRSIGNVSQFSKPVFESSEALKFDLLQRYFLTFRGRANEYIDEQIQLGKTVIHISLHSFVKRFFDVDREVDLGVLFDDHRQAEKVFGRAWIKSLQNSLPNLNVTENQPYYGGEDGHTTAIRRLYSETQYLGIEIEFSQDLDLENEATAFAQVLADSLPEVFNEL